MAAKGGRKNLKRAVNDATLTLQPGQSVMQVVSLRGSNMIEVIDAKGEKTLAIFPAKFQKSMWIKRSVMLFCCICLGAQLSVCPGGRPPPRTF
ncbi:putative RNA-binding protein EIF1AD [Helianthus anomalus]